MKTTTLIPTLLALTIQVMVNGQTQGNPANQIKIDKVNLHVVQQHKKASTKKALPILGFKLKNIAIETAITKNYSYNQLIVMSQSFALQANQLNENVIKLNGDNKILQLEIVNELKKQAYTYQLKASEISFQNTLSEFNFNKLEFYSLLKLAPQINDIITKCTNTHNEAEYNLKLAKEIRQEAYAMPNLASIVGTLSNAEEKEYLALKKQNQAIELLQTISASIYTLKNNSLCLK